MLFSGKVKYNNYHIRKLKSAFNLHNFPYEQLGKIEERSTALVILTFNTYESI